MREKNLFAYQIMFDKKKKLDILKLLLNLKEKQDIYISFSKFLDRATDFVLNDNNKEEFLKCFYN